MKANDVEAHLCRLMYPTCRNDGMAGVIGFCMSAFGAPRESSVLPCNDSRISPSASWNNGISTKLSRCQLLYLSLWAAIDIVTSLTDLMAFISGQRLSSSGTPRRIDQEIGNAEPPMHSCFFGLHRTHKSDVLPDLSIAARQAHLGPNRA